MITLTSDKELLIETIYSFPSPICVLGELDSLDPSKLPERSLVFDIEKKPTPRYSPNVKKPKWYGGVLDFHKPRRFELSVLDRMPRFKLVVFAGIPDSFLRNKIYLRVFGALILAARKSRISFYLFSEDKTVLREFIFFADALVNSKKNPKVDTKAKNKKKV